jgi:predicted secreted protein
MAYPVQGRDVLFEVFSDVADDYVPVTCMESVTINFTPELIEKTTLSTGAGYDWHERRRGWDINMTGVSDIFSEGRTIFTMVDPDEINATYLIRLSFEDSLGNTAVFTGSAKLDAASINAIVGDLSDFDLNMKGIGVYELLQTIGGIPGGGTLFSILQEGGDGILLENGDEIIQENG